MQRFRFSRVGLGVAMGLSLLACTPQAYFNNTASLGGATPGSRGVVGVVFDNQTPYRAVCTYGAFDQQDRAFLFNSNQAANRQIGQFVLNPDPTSVVQASLLGNTTSTEVTFINARTLSVGTQRLIEVIQMSRLPIALDDEAMKPGISFWPDDPTATQPVGRIDGVTLLEGYDFQPGSLVVYTLAQNADGSFAIQSQVILP